MLKVNHPILESKDCSTRYTIICTVHKDLIWYSKSESFTKTWRKNGGAFSGLMEYFKRLSVLWSCSYFLLNISFLVEDARSRLKKPVTVTLQGRGGSKGVDTSKSTSLSERGLVSNSKKSELMKKMTYTIENKPKVPKVEHKEKILKTIKKEGEMFVIHSLIFQYFNCLYISIVHNKVLNISHYGTYTYIISSNNYNIFCFQY